jgi:hypothetical protein
MAKPRRNQWSAVSTAGRYHSAPGDYAIRCDGQRRTLEELTRAELLLLVEAAFPGYHPANHNTVLRLL